MKSDEVLALRAKFLAEIWDGSVPIPSQRTFTEALVMAEADRTVDEKTTTVSYDLNCMALSKLLLSISGATSSGKVAFAKVDSSQTAENPDGEARQAWSRLVSKYALQMPRPLLKWRWTT